MRAFALASALLASLLVPSQSLSATDGVFLPPAPQGSGGEDSIETAEGTRCRQSINSSGPYADLGVAGRAASPQSDTPGATTPFYGYPGDRDREGLLYARITIPLGRKPQRIDCSRLYELEIARLKQQVELLTMAAQ